MIATDSTVAHYLKSKSSALHGAVEKSMGAQRIFSESYSKSEYAKLLQRLHTAHYMLEPIIYDFKSIWQYPELDLEKRLSKAALLEQDLDALGQKPKTQTIDVHIAHEAEAWGALYVMEGSSLGGMVILKQLKTLQWAEEAFTYYNCYGSDTGPMWRLFLACLEQTAEQNGFKRETMLMGVLKAYGVYMQTH